MSDPFVSNANISTHRLRRLRASPGVRRLATQHRVHADDLVMPLFVDENIDGRLAIDSMPGQFRLSVEEVVRECKELYSLGLPAVLLFGIPAEKDSQGSQAYSPQGIVQQAIRQIRQEVPELTVIADVCLCEYTDHGHCGVLNQRGRQSNHSLPADFLLNDKSLELHAKTAVSLAQAGADIVAPSGRLDGLVKAIRASLDGTDLWHTPIMSYAVKMASAFYGPFRDAADGSPAFGDRRTHQMDPANESSIHRQAKQDMEQGADFLIVKPATSCLDIITRLKDARLGPPIATYHVSGEYSMLKAAAARGWLDEDKAVHEVLVSLKRAGADLIISYFAKQFVSKS